MISSETILIRADSSTTIGIGHIKRCAGLAQALTCKGKKVVFVSKPLQGNIIHLLKNEGHKVLTCPYDEIEYISSVSRDFAPRWIVLDHPETGAEYERKIKSVSDAKLAVIDGQYRHHACDLLLNPNCYATEENCINTVPGGCRILAGYDYYILQDEYLGRGRSTSSQLELRILVTLGGADPENITLSVCQALRDLDFKKSNVIFEIVLGPANKHISDIRTFLISEKDDRFRLHEKPTDLFSLIDRSNLCISSGGITMGEIAYLEKPVIGVEVAENQKRTIETLADKGAIIHGDLDRIGEQVLRIVGDPALQKRLILNISGLVDGKGKYRIVDEMFDEAVRHADND